MSDRRNKLPAYLYAAEITLQKAKIAVLESQKAEAQTNHKAVGDSLAGNIGQVFDEIAATETHLKSLYSKRDNLQLSEGSSYAIVREIAIKIEREQNILKQLINKQVNTEPVLDSAYERSDVAMLIRSGYGEVSRPEQQTSSAAIPASAHVEILQPGQSWRVEYDGD